MKIKRFTEFEDETIQSYVEIYAHNVSVAIRLVAKVLKRDVRSVKSRYYLKRGDYRPLFYLIDNKENKIFYNTKNCGGRTKFREDIYTPTAKHQNSPPLKLSNFTAHRNIK